MIVTSNYIFIVSCKLEILQKVSLKDVKIVVLHQLDHQVIVLNSIGQPDILLRMKHRTELMLYLADLFEH